MFKTDIHYSQFRFILVDKDDLILEKSMNIGKPIIDQKRKKSCNHLKKKNSGEAFYSIPIHYLRLFVK